MVSRERCIRGGKRTAVPGTKNGRLCNAHLKGAQQKEPGHIAIWREGVSQVIADNVKKTDTWKAIGGVWARLVRERRR